MNVINEANNRGAVIKRGTSFNKPNTFRKKQKINTARIEKSWIFFIFTPPITR